jgi:hypothetical protein
VQGVVEVGKTLPAALVIKGMEVLLVVVEIRCLSVTGHQGIPVLMAPVAMLGDKDFAHRHTAMRIDHRHGEGKCPVRRIYKATVHRGLLAVGHGKIKRNLLAKQTTVIFYGTQICCCHKTKVKFFPATAKQNVLFLPKLHALEPKIKYVRGIFQRKKLSLWRLYAH